MSLYSYGRGKIDYILSAKIKVELAFIIVIDRINSKSVQQLFITLKTFYIRDD